MSSYKHCCVPGCKESTEKPPLHIFPHPQKDRVRFNTWLSTIGGDVLGLDNERIFKYRHVCHKHFEAKYSCRNSRLSNITVPTLNLAGLNQATQSRSTDRIPFQEIVNQPIHSMPTVSDVASHKEALPSTSQFEFKQGFQTDTAQKLQQTVLSQQVAAAIVPSTSQLESKKRFQTNIGRKISVRTKRFLSVERDLHLKIVAAKRKIYKLKNKAKKQMVRIKEAKKLVNDPAVLDTLENCSNKGILAAEGKKTADRGCVY